MPVFPYGRRRLQIHLCFFSHSIKICGLPLTAASHCLAALPVTIYAFKSSAAASFSAKITSFTKNSLDLKKITRFTIFTSKFAVLLEMI